MFWLLIPHMYIDILYIYIHMYIYIYTYICLFHSFSSGPGFQGPGFICVQTYTRRFTTIDPTYIYIFIYVYVCIYIYIFIEKNTYRTYTYMKIYLFISLILQWTWFPAPWFVLTCFPYFPVVVRCPNSCWCHILFPKAQSMWTWSATVKTLERPGLAALAAVKWGHYLV